MSAGRTYNIVFRGVSVSAAQDLCTATATSGMALEVVSVTLGQISLTTVEALPISIKRLSATVTAGSSGSSFTPTKDTPTDPAATFTARINDTTQATSSGATDYLHPDVFNEVNGYQWIWPERARPSCKPSEALIFSLDGAPGSARTMSGSMKVRELF
jgi:hypothetical protein